MNREAFCKTENWYGSYYELCLEIGAAGCDEHLLSAVQHLWAQPCLVGSWTDCQAYDGTPEDITSIEDALAHRYGVLKVGGVELGCLTCVVREEGGSDWLDLCVPTAMLELAFGLSYPLERAENPWMTTIDLVYLGIAASVFASCSFRMGVVGEEVSGVVDAATVSRRDLERGIYLLPDPLAESLEVSARGIRQAAGLLSFGAAGEEP